MSNRDDFRKQAALALATAELWLIHHKENYDEIKTIGHYSRVLNHNVLLLYNGEMTESEFVDDLAKLIEEQFTRAWREGAVNVGFDPDQMTDEQAEALQERILTEYDHVDNYAAQIRQASANGESVGPYQDRVDMWANRYNEVRDEARIEFSKGTGQMFEWVLGPTEEHCDTCGGLAGIVATADEWDESGYKPQSQDLACHGYHCLCELRPTDKEKTKGGIPNV